MILVYNDRPERRSKHETDPILKIKDSRAIAAKWLDENCNSLNGYVGGYLSGSTAWGDPDAEFRLGSDVDLFVVVDGQAMPERPGKTLVDDVVLEINFIDWNSISNPDDILSDYHLAGAFVCDGLLRDPDGRIAGIRQAVAKEFAAPDRIMQRCAQAKDRATSFIAQFRQHTELHDKVTCLFFGAGVCAHMILVVDQKNPTIRRRYAEMQKTLQAKGQLELHERLLKTLGSADWTKQIATQLLQDVATSFDLACLVMRSPYQFASDMTEAARPIAIGGSQEMIDASLHREAAFWLVAIAARSRAVVVQDGTPEQLREVDAQLWRLLDQLGISDDSAMDWRAMTIEADIEACWNASERIVYGQANIT